MSDFVLVTVLLIYALCPFEYPPGISCCNFSYHTERGSGNGFF